MEHADTRPDAVALSWRGESSEVLARWSHRELLHRAHGVAASLRAFAGEAAGAPRVLLLAPQGLDYIAGFYRALLAAVIPVTLPAPRSRRSVERVCLVAENCAPSALLRAIGEAPALSALPPIVLDQSSGGLQPALKLLRAEAHNYIAFLQ